MATQTDNSLHSQPEGFKSLSATPSKPLRVLNLYAGIGGNRKLWENVEVTAVENVQVIADIYKDLFPNDTVIVADAHEYLLQHFQEFDFIWSSPPCTTHSRLNYSPRSRAGFKYPDMRLYQEILLLKHFCKTNWVVENVKGYYEPLIIPQELGRHYFWSNLHFPKYHGPTSKVRHDKGSALNTKMLDRGIHIADFHEYKGDKRQLLTNAVEPELGSHILNAVQGKHQVQVSDLVATDHNANTDVANPPSDPKRKANT